LKKDRILRVEQGHWVQRPGQGVLELAGPPDGIEGVKLGGAAVKVLDGTMEL
jgi:predicted PhzF superfamily epimerase YddE/YHI9